MQNEFDFSDVHIGMNIKVLMVLLIGILGSQMSIGQEWKVYESLEGQFSILTPGLMEKKRATISTGIAPFDVHTFFYNTKDTSGNFLYLLNYYDFPEDMMHKDSTDLAMEFLLNTMDQSVSDVEGDLQYSNPVFLGSHQGLMWRSRSKKGVVKCKAFIINNRFYMLQVFSIPDKALNSDVDRFLESFTLKT